MTRKEFINDCMALGLGLPFLSFLLKSCSKEADLYDDFEVNFSGKVLIIGAGSAGITAGHVLNKYNIDFQIIEASPNFGGRVKRLDSFADFPIDLGGEWIHEAPSVLAKLISDSSVQDKIDVITYSPDTIYNWKNDKLKKQNWAGNFYSEYKFKNTTWYGFFEKYMVANFSDKIVYNSPVAEIDYSGEKVLVTNTNNEVFEGDKILVTVPIKILQSDMITFTPSLPTDKTDAIHSVDMPDGLKVFIEFSEKFYPDILLFGNVISAALSSNKTYYDAAFGKDSDKNILGLFTVGDPAAEYTDLQTDTAIFNKVMSELDEIFDGKATETYVKHVIQNWSQEPFIQGSYSHDYEGSRDNIIDTILQPVDNKLYFAGEALSKGNQATVPGAAETGYDAIEAILQS